MSGYRELLIDICKGIVPNDEEKTILSDMRSVDLSGTKITSIEQLIPFISRVRKFDLNNTAITVLPDNINFLQDLEEVSAFMFSFNEKGYKPSLILLIFRGIKVLW